MKTLEEFYKNKKVLVTGHTGFKGSWMCMMLNMLGADVYGYALEPDGEVSLFSILNIDNTVSSFIGDIRDYDKLDKVLDDTKPEVVIHMAAQPLVRESYKSPKYTYETNVIGTVNVLECIRKCESVKSFINVTTDKVYRNEERDLGYKEDEYLDGYDPYSNSKSCSELVTSSYRNSFFSIPVNESMEGASPFDENGKRLCAISTCRAGNVIGGGDFASDRIIPDCVRAAIKNEDIIIRNPYSIRPYQHVLEPIYVYLLLAMDQYYNPAIAGAYNVGPDDSDCKTTGEIADLFCKEWNRIVGNEVKWINVSDNGPHEAKFLKLDCSKLKGKLSWIPRWNIDECMEKIVIWYSTWNKRGDIYTITRKQIKEFIGEGLDG